MRTLALTLILILTSFTAFAEFGRSTSFDDREICDKNKGVWREFGNSAGDRCESKMDPYSIAAQALTYACDCGKGRCWDGDKCAVMQDFKKIYNQKLEKEQKKISEAKKARQEEYRDKTNRRLRELIGGSGPSAGNNRSQFVDKIPALDLPPVTVDGTPITESIPSPIVQQTQDFVNQGAEAAKENGSAMGGFFSVPSVPQQAPTIAAPTIPTVPSNEVADGPTPFFLQQQEKAKKEAEASAAEAKGITIIDPPAIESGLPALPQIPLPQ